MNITEMYVKVCVKCFCVFFVRDVCTNCGSKEREALWCDDSGDHMFILVSNVHEKYATGWDDPRKAKWNDLRIATFRDPETDRTKMSVVTKNGVFVVAAWVSAESELDMRKLIEQRDGGALIDKLRELQEEDE